MDFENEVARLRPWLHGLAHRYYREVEDMEDLVSETICKALQNKNKYNGEKALKPWLETIMQNTYITLYNRARNVQFVRCDAEWVGVSQESAEEYAELRDMLDIINRCRGKSLCVDSLLKYMEGYSYEEIGNLYRIPVGTVRSRISAARSLIRKEFGL